MGDAGGGERVLDGPLKTWDKGTLFLLLQESVDPPTIHANKLIGGSIETLTVVHISAFDAASYWMLQLLLMLVC